MARTTASFVQHRWQPKSSSNNNHQSLHLRGPDPKNAPQSSCSNDDIHNVNEKGPHLDTFHPWSVYRNNFYYMTMMSTPLVKKLRSLGVTMILIAILGILLFHPPCYRQRAKGMPLCRISRDLGIIPPLPPKHSNKTKTVRVRRKRNESPQRGSSRILLGFMTFGNSLGERRRRAVLRKHLFMARDSNGKQVCSLRVYLTDAKRSGTCRIVYTFVQGGNPEGIHLDFNKTYPSSLEYQQTSFYKHGSSLNKNEEKDMIFLNVQDINNVRKVFAWFDYTTKIKLSRVRQFDYIGITDTRYSIDVNRFLGNEIFDSPIETTKHVYGGVLWQKSNCDYKYRNHAKNNNDCFEACPKITTNIFMSEFVVLSRELINYCLAHSNLVQLSGVYPQNCPDLTIASLLGFHLNQEMNITHLDGIIYS